MTLPRSHGSIVATTLCMGLAASVIGCTAPDLRWSVRFDDPELSDRALAVDAHVREGGCDGPILYTFEEGGAAEMEELPPGEYALTAVAYDETCTPFAGACVTVTVPRSEAAQLTLTERGADPECGARECVEGRCEEAADAGPADAGGPPDAGVSRDAGPDSGSDGGRCGECRVPSGGDCSPAPDGTMCLGGECRDGACCRGCWNGASCLPGSETGACGTGGGACATCLCDDACVEGACEVDLPAVAIATGENHTCAILEDERLMCWGRNMAGQGGFGTFTARVPIPTPIDSDERWRSIAAGRNHTCAITDGNRLYCWGTNGGSQLGFEPPHVGNVPAALPGMWESVSAGGNQTCAIATDGTLHCWGSGDGPCPGTVETPTQLGSDTDWREVAVGARHVCGIRGTPGDLYCWGCNDEGQLGNGLLTVTSLDFDAAYEHGEARVVVAGDAHTCAMPNTSFVGCWGANWAGQVGVASTGSPEPTPVPLPPPGGGVERVYSTGSFSTCWTVGGALSCWGDNRDGRLGVERVDIPVVDQPTPVLDAPPNVVEVATQRLTTCARTGDGAIYCWGEQNDGRLGNRQIETGFVGTPTRVCLRR